MRKYTSKPFPTPELKRLSVNSTPWLFYPRERTGLHFTGVWQGFGAGLNGHGKSLPPPGFNPRTIQSVPSRYADCATPSPHDLNPSTHIIRIIRSGRMAWMRYVACMRERDEFHRGFGVETLGKETV
jgi:hypothetical protein